MMKVSKMGARRSFELFVGTVLGALFNVPVALGAESATRDYELDMTGALPNHSAAEINVSSTNSRGELVVDHFYFGQPWEIGLKRFLKDGSAELLFYFRPLEAERSYSADLAAAGVEVPAGKRVLHVSKVTLTPEYQFDLTFQ